MNISNGLHNNCTNCTTERVGYKQWECFSKTKVAMAILSTLQKRIANSLRRWSHLAFQNGS